MATQSNHELLDNLKVLVRDMLRLRNTGVAHAKLARAQGLVDGYMRVLLEAGLADHKALLAIVSEERRGVDGPATSAVAAELDRHATDHEDARVVAA
jgi:hypothetical protein